MGCSCPDEKFENNSKSKIENETKNEISFKCTYEIKDFNEIQILNYRGTSQINEEIKSKIKILNGNKIEDLIFVKKFDSLGMNTINFIIEKKMTNLKFLFNGCSALKKIEFISFDTKYVSNMCAMF